MGRAQTQIFFVGGKRNKWTSLENYIKTFEVGTDLTKKFTLYAQENFAVPYSAKGLIGSQKAIAKTLKAEIARQIWLENGYYFIANQTDNEVQVIVKKMMGKP